MSESIVSVEGLRVEFETDRGSVRAVDGISYTVAPGRTLALVGESGAGKTTSSLTMLGLTRGPRTRISGRIMYAGQDLVGLDDEGLRRIRGNDIAMLVEDSRSALHPLHRVGAQLIEAVRTHRGVTTAAARDRAVGLLELVGIPDPHRRLDAYPHEFSAGMRQRVAIAVAVANAPKLLIADEPTAALGVTVQAQILALLDDVRKRIGMAMVFITDDLGVAGEIADEIAVVYAGRIVERGTTEQILASPQHPYTWGLLGSMPWLGRVGGEEPAPISGSPPSPMDRPSGCRFHPRCPYAQDSHKRIDPQLRPVEGEDGHAVACLLEASVRRQLWEGLAAPGELVAPQPLGGRTKGSAVIEVRSVVRRLGAVNAVDDVTFSVVGGETVGIVGETGSGKSTMARLIVGLLEPTSGEVRVRGEDISALRGSRRKELHGEVQMIFQDPYSSLNPHRPVGASIGEAYAIHGIHLGPGQRRQRVQELMHRVGLDPEHHDRYPHEFSVDQCQRIGIARALALEPKILVADEPVSALDLSLGAQVLSLLRDLQRELGLTLIITASDLSVVRHLCDRVAVMYVGKLVELASAQSLYGFPRHPYTGALLSALPVPDPAREGGRRELLAGDLPSPADPPAGCRFHTRCPKAQAVCSAQEPPLVDKGGDVRAACHFPLTREEADRALPAMLTRGDAAPLIDYS